MPPEYYLGAAVAVVILVLLASFFRRGTSRRRISSQSSDATQLVSQLSRIADALEKLVIHTGSSSPTVDPPSAPLAKMPETKPADEVKDSESPKKHVTMSMFGR